MPEQNSQKGMGSQSKVTTPSTVQKWGTGYSDQDDGSQYPSFSMLMCSHPLYPHIQNKCSPFKSFPPKLDTDSVSVELPCYQAGLSGEK